jgi:hypothetical protein
VLRAHYGIPLDRIYALNWIDDKDARCCEGCELAKLARECESKVVSEIERSLDQEQFLR